ncbi:MAG: acetyltransferase [Chloroflexi bacterium]|nr:acetyltransferase [Chloroflexota bacterium]
MRVVLVGAGGHAQVVADILLRMREAGIDLTPIGYVDDDPALGNHMRLGLPVLGKIADLSRIEHDAIIVAIGKNDTRRRLFLAFQAQGERFVTACHPRAVIAPDVKVGPGSMICAGAIVNTGSIIGANVILNTGSTVDHHNIIADHVHIAPGVHLGGEVRVGEGALLGIGTTVMPRHQVGQWSTVGAGALVHSDLPDNVIAVGIPARVIRHIPENEGLGCSA